MEFYGRDRELLIWFLFFALGVYINRFKFKNLEHQVFGFYIPLWAITLLTAIIFGFFCWLMLHILLWVF